MAKRRPSALNKVATKGAHVSPTLDDFSGWQSLAETIIGNDDAWHVNELATLLQEQAKLTAAHWPAISEICDKTEEKTINVGLGWAIDRRNSPPEATCKLSYSERFADNLNSKVPDPNQEEMPLFRKRGEKDANTSTRQVPTPDAEVET